MKILVYGQNWKQQDGIIINKKIIDNPGVNEVIIAVELALAIFIHFQFYLIMMLYYHLFRSCELNQSKIKEQ